MSETVDESGEAIAEETVPEDGEATAAPSEPSAPEPVAGPARVEVSVCVRLSGLKLGQRVWVDPSDPYIANAISHGHLELVGM